MFDEFTKEFLTETPKTFKECQKVDKVSIKLLKYARWFKGLGCAIGFAILLLCSLVQEEFSLYGAILGVSVSALFEFFSLLIKALSRIVQNTYFMANVLFFNCKISNEEGIKRADKEEEKRKSEIEKCKKLEIEKQITANEKLLQNIVLCNKCGADISKDCSKCHVCGEEIK